MRWDFNFVNVVSPKTPTQFRIISRFKRASTRLCGIRIVWYTRGSFCVRKALRVSFDLKTPRGALDFDAFSQWTMEGAFYFPSFLSARKSYALYCFTVQRSSSPDLSPFMNMTPRFSSRWNKSITVSAISLITLGNCYRNPLLCRRLYTSIILNHSSKCIHFY